MTKQPSDSQIDIGLLARKLNEQRRSEVDRAIEETCEEVVANNGRLPEEGDIDEQHS